MTSETMQNFCIVISGASSVATLKISSDKKDKKETDENKKERDKKKILIVNAFLTVKIILSNYISIYYLTVR